MAEFDWLNPSYTIDNAADLAQANLCSITDDGAWILVPGYSTNELLAKKYNLATNSYDETSYIYMNTGGVVGARILLDHDSVPTVIIAENNISLQVTYFIVYQFSGSSIWNETQKEDYWAYGEELTDITHMFENTDDKTQDLILISTSTGKLTALESSGTSGTYNRVVEKDHQLPGDCFSIALGKGS